MLVLGKINLTPYARAFYNLFDDLDKEPDAAQSNFGRVLVELKMFYRLQSGLLVYLNLQNGTKF